MKRVRSSRHNDKDHPTARPDAAAAPRRAGTPKPGPEGIALPRSLGVIFGPDKASRLEGTHLHTGPAAAAVADGMDARAVAIGRDVFFAKGEFDPGSARGRKLLAHELAHVALGHRGPKRQARSKAPMPAPSALTNEELILELSAPGKASPPGAESGTGTLEAERGRRIAMGHEWLRETHTQTPTELYQLFPRGSVTGVRRADMAAALGIPRDVTSTPILTPAQFRRRVAAEGAVAMSAAQFAANVAASRAPSSPPAHPRLIADLQGGPALRTDTGAPTFLPSTAQATPNARGLLIEPGDFVPGYAGITTTDAQDLAMLRVLSQNLPRWPDVPPGTIGPQPAPWEADPRLQFPTTGPVRILTIAGEPGRTPVPDAFFPPLGGEVQPGLPRLIPIAINGGTAQADVTGLSPSTHPQLHGQVDQIYWRRPFAISSADPATANAMGAEIAKWLRPGGFVELRLLRAGDAAMADTVAANLPGSRIVEVPRAAIRGYAATGQRPPGLSDEAWTILEAAGPDIRGDYGALGEGQFARIVRIYRSGEPVPPPPLAEGLDPALAWRDAASGFDLSTASGRAQARTAERVFDPYRAQASARPGGAWTSAGRGGLAGVLIAIPADLAARGASGRGYDDFAENVPRTLTTGAVSGGLAGAAEPVMIGRTSTMLIQRGMGPGMGPGLGAGGAMLGARAVPGGIGGAGAELVSIYVFEDRPHSGREVVLRTGRAGAIGAASTALGIIGTSMAEGFVAGTVEPGLGNVIGVVVGFGVGLAAYLALDETVPQVDPEP